MDGDADEEADGVDDDDDDDEEDVDFDIGEYDTPDDNDLEVMHSSYRSTVHWTTTNSRCQCACLLGGDGG